MRLHCGKYWVKYQINLRIGNKQLYELDSSGLCVIFIFRRKKGTILCNNFQRACQALGKCNVLFIKALCFDHDEVFRESSLTRWDTKTIYGYRVLKYHSFLTLKISVILNRLWCVVWCGVMGSGNETRIWYSAVV